MMESSPGLTPRFSRPTSSMSCLESEHLADDRSFTSPADAPSDDSRGDEGVTRSATPDERLGTCASVRACTARSQPVTTHSLRVVLARRRLPRSLPVDLATQQELPDPVPGAHQIHANVLPAAHQIVQLPTLDRRYRDQRQLPGGQRAGRADCIALIGLDPIRRRSLSLARRAQPISIPAARARPRQP
jgi:hypothetical protein